MAPQWDIEGLSFNNLYEYTIHKFRISSEAPPQTKESMLVSTRTYQKVGSPLRWNIIEKKYGIDVSSCSVPPHDSGLVLVVKATKVKEPTKQSQQEEIPKQ